jgi:DNA replication protein DnaC
VGNFERTLAALTKADLLIIDDFALKPMRPGQDEDFHDVIADRYERRPTIIASNLDFSEWNDAFHNKLLGGATLDRIKHGTYQIMLDGKSYRTPRMDVFLAEATHKRVIRRGRPSENLSLLLALLGCRLVAPLGC